MPSNTALPIGVAGTITITIAALWFIISTGPRNPSGPLYNVTVEQRVPAPEVLGPKGLVVPNKVPNQATFWVGPWSSVSVSQSGNASASIAERTGMATVAFQCLACSDQQPHELPMPLRDGQSERPLEFLFLPDRKYIAANSGVGTLVFTVSVESTPIDRVAVPLLIEPFTEADKIAYHEEVALTGTARLGTLQPNDRGIDLLISYYTKDHRLGLDAKPISPRLRDRLAQLGWKRLAAVDGAVSFDSVESDDLTLENGLGDTYRRLRSVIRADAALRAAIKRLTGTAPDLESAVRLTPKEQASLLAPLATAGEELYAVIAPRRAQALTRFLSDIVTAADEFGKGERPLRIYVSNSTPYYIPWQLLYVRALNAEGSNAAPEGFLGVLAEVAEDPVRLTKFRSSTPPAGLLTGRRILYGRWRSASNDAEDEVSVRASNVYGALQRLVQDPQNIAIASTRPLFLKTLTDRNGELRLIAIYAHGEADTITGGPVLRLNRSEDITPGHIRRSAESVADDPFFRAMPLVILATCELGTGGERRLDADDFPGTFLKLGSAAVVAPISEVWAAYADWFSRDVASFLGSGLDVQAAVRATTLKHLRDNNNPAALLFSVFGDPAFRATLGN